MGSPELYKLIFYRDLHALCISDICFKTVQLREWKIFTKKALKMDQSIKNIFTFVNSYILLLFLLFFSVDPLFVLKKNM